MSKVDIFKILFLNYCSKKYLYKIGKLIIINILHWTTDMKLLSKYFSEISIEKNYKMTDYNFFFKFKRYIFFKLKNIFIIFLKILKIFSEKYFRDS